jgi:hypothetical protein
MRSFRDALYIMLTPYFFVFSGILVSIFFLCFTGYLIFIRSKMVLCALAGLSASLRSAAKLPAHKTPFLLLIT